MTLYARRLTTFLSLLAAGMLLNVAVAGDEMGQKDCGQKATCQKGIHDAGCGQKGSCGKGGCGPQGFSLGLRACADCGCAGKHGQVCRLVKKPLVKEVDCYRCDCETICLPGHSKRGCRNVSCVSCGGDKDGKGCGGKCGSCGTEPHDVKVVWFDWNAGKGKDGGGCGLFGGRGRTVKKLMKKTVEAEIKGAYEYEWETVDMCKDCEMKYEKFDEKVMDGVEPEAEVPPPPAIDAQLLYGKPIVERTASATITR